MGLVEGLNKYLSTYREWSAVQLVIKFQQRLYLRQFYFYRRGLSVKQNTSPTQTATLAAILDIP